jgi:hypothetical protein
MIETVVVELCPSCVLAIYLGTGHAEVVEPLWRLFAGGVIVDTRESYTSFRPCGCCGSEATALRYTGTATIHH